MADRQTLQLLSRKLTDEGKLMEAGWIGMRLHVVPLDAPADQLQEMRMAFMAGAQHLFSSIMTILEPGAEPTDTDLQRMSLINDELQAYGKELAQRVSRPSPEPPPSPQTLGTAPIEDQYREKMNQLAGALDEFLNGKDRRDKRKNGFVLLVFPFAHGGRCNYISNAERADVVTMMKEQLAYFEGQPDTMESRA